MNRENYVPISYAYDNRDTNDPKILYIFKSDKDQRMA